LTKVDRQNVSEGGIVAESLKVDELDKNIRVFLRIAVTIDL
jgi:hypothetical protein